MKYKILFSVIAGIALLATPFVASAQQAGSLDVPRTISYQGVLTASDGIPMPNGTYDITVTLYGDEAGTQSIWRHTYSTPVLNGVFNLYLGSGSAPLPNPELMNRPLWVGTAVNGMEEMSPLTPLSSSPYALNLPDRTVTTGKLADGAVTAEKVDMPYVAGVRINGQDVSGNGVMLSIQSGKDIDVRYDEVTESMVIESRGTTGTGDAEKGATVQDAMGNVSQNWIGRDAAFAGAVNVPFYDVANAATSTYNTLAGGYRNLIRDSSHYNFIGGGRENVIRGDYNFIGGGGGTTSVVYTSKDTNAIHRSNYGVIGGGRGNLIDTAHDATIGGGIGNWIQRNSFVDNLITNESGATIAGGGGNLVRGYYATIGGGHHNFASGHLSFIGGGGDTVHNNLNNGANQATAQWTVVTGGQNNRSTAEYAFVGGGKRHRAAGNNAFIGGGDSNVIRASSEYGVVGGGQLNEVISSGGTIAGGNDNLVDSLSGWSFIGSGEINSIKNAGWAVVAGGRENRITSTAGGGGNLSFIGGGDSNYITNQYSVINGGFGNSATDYNGTIGGGRLNVVTGHTGTIGGGFSDTVNALEAVIAGGSYNRIFTNAIQSTIGGGSGNKIRGTASGSTIGGGIGNIITSTGIRSTIPGGEFLIAEGYGQTVLGFFNEYKGTMPFRKIGATLTQLDEPIFMIGNGDTITSTNSRSNAFEVSYNGHSIVYDENGTGGLAGGPGRGAIDGGTYTDNVIYGWANVDGAGRLIGGCDDFGVADIQHFGAGVYRVTLNIVEPDGTTPATIDCGAVVATVGTGDDPAPGEPVNPVTQCVQIITTNIKGNIFDVFITMKNPGSDDCNEGIDMPFKFHVTGRVQ